jgi:hypothetical protein
MTPTLAANPKSWFISPGITPICACSTPQSKLSKLAARSGFTCAPDTLKSDPWLVPLRKHRELGSLLSNAEDLVEKARFEFHGTCGEFEMFSLNQSFC